MKSVWQPIETAPRDGTQILIGHFGNRISICDDCWNPHAYVDDDIRGWWWRWGSGPQYLSPTHWMPLPEPPKGKEGE